MSDGTFFVTLCKVNYIAQDKAFFQPKKLGPVVQNLTKLLVKVTLKFLSSYMAYTLMFFAEKIQIGPNMFPYFSTKTYTVAIIRSTSERRL